MRFGRQRSLCAKVYEIVIDTRGEVCGPYVLVYRVLRELRQLCKKEEESKVWKRVYEQTKPSVNSVPGTFA